MKIFYSAKAQKELLKLEKSLSQRIHKKLGPLADDPYARGNKKLEKEEGYRTRVGNYRVVYIIDKTNKEITIIKIRHRKEVYK